MNASKKLMNQNNDEKNKSKKAKAPTSKRELGSTGQGVNKKAVVAGGLCGAVILALCIGVGAQQFKPQTVLKINDTKFTLDDMMYPIYEKESQYLPSNELYQNYMGTSVWESSYSGDDPNVASGTSNADGLKQEIMDDETEYQVLYEESQKEKKTLTDDEKKDVEKEAEKALKGLSFMQKLQLSISKSKLVKRFEKRKLADNYKEAQKETINKSVNESDAIKDVSKEDYKQYDIEYYTFSKKTTDANQNEKERSADEINKLKEKLTDLAKKAKKAKADEFAKLLENDKDITYSTAKFTEKEGWSTLSTDNVAKVKKLKKGAVSDVISDETTGNYVLVLMKDNTSTESYDDACKEAVEKAQSDAYYEWLKGIEQGYKIKIYDEVWDDIIIGETTTEIVTAEDLSKMAEDASSDAKSSK